MSKFFVFAMFKSRWKVISWYEIMQVKEKAIVSTIDGSKRIEVEALFNTGAKSTFISEELAKQLGFRLYLKPIKIPLAIKGKTGVILGESTLAFTITGCEIPFGYTVRVVKT